jgi:hypothetical protein
MANLEIDHNQSLTRLAAAVNGRVGCWITRSKEPSRQMLPQARADLKPAFHLAILHPPSAARHSANIEHRIRAWSRARPVIRFKPLDGTVDNPEQRAPDVT